MRVLAHGETQGPGEPFATMPIDELRAAAAALSPASTLDRRARALALLPYIRAIIEKSPHENEVLLGIEAFEMAWAHFRPGSREPGSHVDYVFAERLISQLNWSLRLILSEAPPPLPDIIGALAEMDDSIPVERWEDAVNSWLGERRSSRGRPPANPGPYFWHRVLHRLLTGRDDVIEANNFRDNFTKWRVERRR